MKLSLSILRKNMETVTEENDKVGEALMVLIKAGEEDRFCRLLKKEICVNGRRCMLQFVNDDEECDSLLTAASFYNLPRAVSLLLKFDAEEPEYHIFREDIVESIRLALDNGHPKVLRILLNSISPSEMKQLFKTGTPLHYSVGLCHTSPSHNECFLEIVDMIDKKKDWIDVQEPDVDGANALDWALLYGKKFAVPELMRLKCKMCVESLCHGVEHNHIPHDALQKHLDDHMTRPPAVNEMGVSIDVVEMDFSLLNSKTADNENTSSSLLQPAPKIAPVTKLLWLMGKSRELRPLLTHPLVTSFLILKWRRLRPIFIVNFIFSLIFTGYLTIHILLMSSSNQSDLTFSRVIVWILLLVLFLREAFQLAIKPKWYFVQFENYLEILTIVFGLCITIKCNDAASWNTEGSVCPEFGAIAMLTTWVDLFLLLGKSTTVALQIEIFIEVFKRFAQFFAVYAIIVVAFAFSFFVLFENCTDCSDNPFSNMGLTLFKTFVMMSGEFDSSSLPLNANPYTSHTIFISFVFVVAIIILNLLNGLAVYDIKIIQEDAQLHSTVKRISYVNSLEILLQTTQTWGKVGRYVSKLFLDFPNKITVKFGKNSNVITTAGLWKIRPCLNAVIPPKKRKDLDPEILHAAFASHTRPKNVQDLLEEQTKLSKARDDLFEEKFEALQGRFSELMAQNQSIQNSLKRIESMLSLDNETSYA